MVGPGVQAGFLSVASTLQNERGAKYGEVDWITM